MAANELDAFLRPGERVLEAARPRGAVPLFRSGEILFYANGVLFVGGLLALWWVWFRSFVVPFRLGDLRIPITPLALLPAMALLFAYEWGSWRGRRYLLTDQRILVIRGLWRRQATGHERSGTERIRRRLDGDVVIEGCEGGPLRLSGFDQADLDAWSAALGQEEP